MPKLVLNELLLSHFLPQEPCPKCGRPRKGWTLLYPNITRHGNLVRVIYPILCAGCKYRTCMTQIFPVLELGYMLVKHAIFESWQRFARTKQTLTLLPGSWRGVADLNREYRELVADICAAGRNQLDEGDRVLLGLTEREWEEFVRRARLDDGDDAGPTANGGRA